MFRKGVLALGLSAGLTAAPSGAAMLTEGADPASGASLVQRAQIELPFPFPVGLFFFGGHDWCWYDDGWQGGGWYWCGYGYRTGYGYGGPEGFHGWREHRYERDWHGGGGGGGERHEFHGGGGVEHREFHGGGGVEHHEFHGGGGVEHHDFHGGGGGAVQHPGGGGGGQHQGGGGGGQRQGGGGPPQPH